MTTETVVALALWVRDAGRYHEDVAACPWVTEKKVDRPGTTPTTPSAVPIPLEFVPDTYNLGPIIDAMTFPGMQVSVVWQKCGEVNGYYYPARKRIVLCHELRAATDASFIRFVMAHEMAHAVIFQLEIAYTGSGEVAADELGAVVLNLLGHSDDVLKVADRWIKRGHPEDPWDDHPGDMRRGLTLRCLASGFLHRHEDGACAWEWRRAIHSWRVLIGATEPS